MVKTETPYIPCPDYRKNVLSTMVLLHDEEFKLEIDPDDFKFTLVSSPVRGNYVMKEVPYGVCLQGYGMETAIYVLLSYGQGGFVVIQVTEMSVDMGCKSKSVIVKYEDAQVAVNDLINRIYFAV